MALRTLDVAVTLPTTLREHAIRCGRELNSLIRQANSAAQFELGAPFPGADTAADVCEPHISLFMLCVDETEISAVVEAIGSVAAQLRPIVAEGNEYRHNPDGAPELFYRADAKWRAVQRVIVAAAEPLRLGRLRTHDPAGNPLAAVLAQDPPHDPAQVRQLREYGYDQIADATDDRLDPHITLAWPANPDLRVDLRGLPEPCTFDATLTDLAVYGMHPYGTCTERFAVFTLDDR